ncbi:hypothetical protein ElyMa_005956500 [Elysia marginata]|uniref:Uncharacterized protein n=1 Tax=Elysia marginata TaxID=1093978 RepID=A0AAV4GAZ5_9GAST|nr:hypothetical protein ElyMa_005956500 [Elysia marginata]
MVRVFIATPYITSDVNTLAVSAPIAHIIVGNIPGSSDYAYASHLPYNDHNRDSDLQPPREPRPPDRDHARPNLQLSSAAVTRAQTAQQNCPNQPQERECTSS